MSVGILWLSFHLPDCHSLKEKRSVIKPMLARLQREFNLSVIEAGYHDLWQSAQLLAVCAALNRPQAEALLNQVIRFFESHWPDLLLTEEKIEIINL